MHLLVRRRALRNVLINARCQLHKREPGRERHSGCAITNNSLELDTLRTRMAALKPALTIQWIPIRCEIPGNEVADSAHFGTADVYNAIRHKKEQLIISRSDQTLLAKLRSGKYIGFLIY